jgi:hypothetical protein
MYCWEWVLKSPTIIVLGVYLPLCLVVFVLWNWVHQSLVTICLQLLYPLDRLFLWSIQSDLFFSLFWYFGLKFAFSDVSTGSPVCFQVLSAWNIIFHLFTLKLCLSLPVRCVSWRQQTVGLFCFLKSNIPVCVF